MTIPKGSVTIHADGRLTDLEANNAQIIRLACNELKRALLRGLTDQTYGETNVSVKRTPGQLALVRVTDQHTIKS